jgi:hypothetical protein
MRDDHLTIRRAVEQAANIWFAKELIEINALLGFSLTKYRSPAAATPIAGKRVIFESTRVKPRTMTLKIRGIRDILVDPQQDTDPSTGEEIALANERERQVKAEVARRKESRTSTRGNKRKGVAETQR